MVVGGRRGAGGGRRGGDREGAGRVQGGCGREGTGEGGENAVCVGVWVANWSVGEGQNGGTTVPQSHFSHPRITHDTNAPTLPLLHASPTPTRPSTHREPSPLLSQCCHASTTMHRCARARATFYRISPTLTKPTRLPLSQRVGSSQPHGCVAQQPINTFIMPFNTYKQPINTAWVRCPKSNML
jgi:hypothetical protein